MGQLDTYTPEQQVYILSKTLRKRFDESRFYRFFPDEDQEYNGEVFFSRHGYPKHTGFFKDGSSSMERCFIAANRIGKTISGAYESVCHLTGEYPDWWEGRRFDRPVNVWVCGKRNITVRDIIQKEILGLPGKFGTGMLPKRLLIGKPPSKPGVPDGVESFKVRHKTGGVSYCTFKSYEQGRDAFEGTSVHFAWLDEEPPLDVYSEILLRLMTTHGCLALTFTPLEGLSDVVLNFMPGGKIPDKEKQNKKITTATWDDVPHLSKEQKDSLFASIPPHQRDARSQGIPQLGSGAIYPVPESDIVVDDFIIPDTWKRVYGLDVGWNRTAAVWAAIDPESRQIFLYSEHYEGQAVPSVHASAIRARGNYPGVIDPASGGRSQKDGTRLIDEYRAEGLELYPADNTVEAGLMTVWQMLSSGQLKVFKTLRHWLAEFRVYRRDERGKIVKVDDHLMDCSRYLCHSGLDYATTGNSHDEYTPDKCAEMYEMYAMPIPTMVQ